LATIPIQGLIISELGEKYKVLSFFTDPYEDEIFYSAIARYHYYYGNNDCKDTLFEIFGSKNVIPTIEFPSKLEYLSQQFYSKKLYSSEYLIRKHTLYPFYSPFLPHSRQVLIQNEMKYGDGKGIFAQIGVTAGSICRKSGLVYCPKCVLDDKEKYREPYFHRIHQLQGVQICPEHKCMLKNYPITRNKESRISFIMLDYEKVDLNFEYINDEKTCEFHNMVSKSAFYLINSDLSGFNQKLIYEKYQKLLGNKGLMTYNGTIKQKEVFTEFISYYGLEILNQLDSHIEFDNMSNWLRMITEKPKKVIHPVRHILFINFLTGSIKAFFEKEFELIRPFGTGPWPCLNPVSKHFRKNVITECIITPDFKTRQPVGTFTCSCGFIYSRKGPDTLEKDRYKIGRIKQFGSTWESKLKELLLLNKYGIRELGKLMSCDAKTIIRYSSKLGMSSYLNSKMSVEKDTLGTKSGKSLELGELFKTDLNYIDRNPGCTRKDIRSAFKKQYAWFYRNDKKWIEQNFPKMIPCAERNKGAAGHVDWNLRDIELLKEIEVEYKKLTEQDKSIRITKSILGKRTGKSAALDMNMDKLPRTKAYIGHIVETIEDFQIRRIREICKQLYESKGSFKKWEVIKKAGLQPDYSKKVDEAINENITRYNV